MNKAVILDRDGIINEDMEYLYKSEDFRFVKGIFQFCKTAQSLGYKLIVATNQSGIARGYYTEEDFFKLNEWMCKKFEEQGVVLDKIYFCPFLPQSEIAKYRCDSPDRKPNAGMLLKAQRDFDLDMSLCVAIGDRDSDMQAARNAGIAKLLLLPGKYKCSPTDDVTVVHSLAEAEKYL